MSCDVNVVANVYYFDSLQIIMQVLPLFISYLTFVSQVTGVV